MFFESDIRYQGNGFMAHGDNLDEVEQIKRVQAGRKAGLLEQAAQFFSQYTQINRLYQVADDTTL